MENVNLTRTNKYIGTNVVDIDDESSFPIHLLNGVKSSNAQSQAYNNGSPSAKTSVNPFNFNKSSKKTPSPVQNINVNIVDDNGEIGESTLAAALQQNDDEDDMDFEGINDAILADENLKNILEGLDIDEEDIEDYVEMDDQQRGIASNRRQQKMHLIQNQQP